MTSADNATGAPPPPDAAGRAPAVRIRRHLAELSRLSGPVIVSRAGIMTLALVDTIMVGRYAVQELAYQSIGLAPSTVLVVVTYGLLLGTLVSAAGAIGRGVEADAGAAWRRALPFALIVGAIGALLCQLGEPLLLATGQSADLAAGGGAVMRVIGWGLPGLALFVATSFFLEGISRPLPAMLAMIAANLLNILLNWLLVYGEWGLPELGAVGSAWATTLVRWAGAALLIGYVWTMAEHARFGVRRRPGGGWRAGVRQRRIGYATAASVGMESTAFAVVQIFAGWLGAMALAATAIAINVVAIVFMVALGLGSATAVRVGVAHGRRDPADLALAGWTGLAACTLVMAAAGAVLLVAAPAIAGVYSTDAALVAVAAPLIAFVAWILVVDGGQAVMANALRGRGDAWVPTVSHALSYFGVMIPAAWLFAFPLGRGALGLLEGILVASIVSVALLSARFLVLARRDRRVGLAPVAAAD
jgi:MATE family multidrug resistance protein